MTIRVQLEEQPGSAPRMAIETTVPSRQTMEQMVTMGMEEGMQSAVGQIDELLRAEVSQT